MPTSLRLFRILECALLFFVVPSAFILAPHFGLFQPSVFLMLGMGAAVCLAVFFLNPIPPRSDVQPTPVKSELKRILLTFSILALAIAVVVVLKSPSSFLSLPRQRPQLWLLIMLLYPLVSVLPQEFLYRRYFFRRYQDAFGGPWATIALSAALFGYVHLLFGSWISVAMTAIGGLLFALTYHRTRSLLVCFIEHSLYGCFVFTIGLGQYFYHAPM